ncbi:nuclear transport factor 2 family protein [Sinorhizobium fredii]|nr:nuclear transport factor 2 family protein [Sinorhizobium fredii]AAQ87345.1 Hypothetical protein RNGR00573 [Sinorhizobium fredii NGR234]
MSGDNPAFATLKRFYAAETVYLAPGGGDFGPIAETLDPGCVLYQPATLPYGGEWRGPEGFRAWMEAFGRVWSHLEVRDPQFYPSGDEVIVSRSHVHATVRATGQAVDWPLMQFFRVRNNRIVELRPFYWDTAALLAGIGGRS